MPIYSNIPHKQMRTIKETYNNIVQLPFAIYIKSKTFALHSIAIFLFLFYN